MNFIDDSFKKGPISQIISRLMTLEKAVRDIQAVLNTIPHMTTLERNAIVGPNTSFIIFNTTTNKLNFYTGVGWEEITSV